MVFLGSLPNILGAKAQQSLSDDILVSLATWFGATKSTSLAPTPLPPPPLPTALHSLTFPIPLFIPGVPVDLDPSRGFGPPHK